MKHMKKQKCQLRNITYKKELNGNFRTKITITKI